MFFLRFIICITIVYLINSLKNIIRLYIYEIIVNFLVQHNEMLTNPSLTSSPKKKKDKKYSNIIRC